MKILGVYLQNYGSFYGRHYIPLLDRGLVSVLGKNLDEPRARSNGAGKSTWSDALDWCLFGEIPRADTVDSIVNDEAKGSCCVTTQLLDDESRLVVVRRLRDYPGKPNGPQLIVGGKDETALDARETQKRIEMVLGMDRAVFHAAVLFGQNDTFQFADASDAERKDILTRILPELQVVDAHLERTTALLVEANAKCVELQRADQDDRNRLEWTKTDIARHEADGAIWEAQHKQMVIESETALRQAQQTLTALTKQMEALGAPVAPAPQPVIPCPQSLTRVRTDLRSAEADIVRLDSQLQSKRAEAKTAIENHQRLQSRAGTCPTCGQEWTQSHSQQELERSDARVKQLTEEGIALRTQRNSADAAVQSLRPLVAAEEAAWAAQQAEASARWGQEQGAIVARQREQESLKRQVVEAAQREYQCVSTLTRVQSQQSPHIARLATGAASVKSLEEKIEARRPQLEAAKKRVEGLEFWKVGFGAKGLKSYVLDDKVAEMAQEANRWVALLTGGTYWVEFATQRKTGKGKAQKMVEDFSIRVSRSNADGTVTTRNYRSWSGGQKYRVALGIDFGLSRLIAKRSTRAYDLLILDEVFQKSLDGAGKEAVAEMLGLLAKEKSSIFVIDHEPNFQGMFDEHITVCLKNRRSRIEGGVHHGVEPQGEEGDDGAGDFLASHSAFPD